MQGAGAATRAPCVRGQGLSPANGGALPNAPCWPEACKRFIAPAATLFHILS